MNNIDDALARLREADPARAGLVDYSESAEDLLARADLHGTTEVQVFHRPRSVSPKRVAFAGVGLAAAAAVLAGGAIAWPGSNGIPASSAYAVTSQPGGSVRVTVDWNKLDDKDFAGFEAAFKQEGINAAVIARSPVGECDEDEASKVVLDRPWTAHTTVSMTGVTTYEFKRKSLAGAVLVFGVPAEGLRADGWTVEFLAKSEPSCVPTLDAPDPEPIGVAPTNKDGSASIGTP
jgi:hypothetical protein